MIEARTQQILVEQSRPGERLDTYLRERFPAVSRGTFKRLIDEGHVQVDGKPAKPTHSPRSGEQVSVFFPPAKPSEITPIDLALEVIYEDEDLLVLNKPAGLVVHPASGEEEATLVHGLLHHCRGSLSGVGGVERPGIVHRLDKDTSGCLVVAKNDSTHVTLSDQFKAREVHKIYHAVTCGRLAHESGEIRAAIARHPNHRMSMVVNPDQGRDAWTSFRILERWQIATLVEARIHTGRTHQIRVHLHHIGHPVAGDAVYGKRQNAQLKESLQQPVARQMLHAHFLEFKHPRDGRTLSFRVPWPEDFTQLVSRLRGATDPLS